jgi:hypothetical protein
VHIHLFLSTISKHLFSKELYNSHVSGGQFDMIMKSGIKMIFPVINSTIELSNILPKCNSFIYSNSGSSYDKNFYFYL